MGMSRSAGSGISPWILGRLRNGNVPCQADAMTRSDSAAKSLPARCGVVAGAGPVRASALRDIHVHCRAVRSNLRRQVA